MAAITPDGRSRSSRLREETGTLGRGRSLSARRPQNTPHDDLHQGGSPYQQHINGGTMDGDLEIDEQQVPARYGNFNTNCKRNLSPDEYNMQQKRFRWHNTQGTVTSPYGQIGYRQHNGNMQMGGGYGSQIEPMLLEQRGRNGPEPRGYQEHGLAAPMRQDGSPDYHLQQQLSQYSPSQYNLANPESSAARLQQNQPSHQMLQYDQRKYPTPQRPRNSHFSTPQAKPFSRSQSVAPRGGFQDLLVDPTYSGGPLDPRVEGRAWQGDPRSSDLFGSYHQQDGNGYSIAENRPRPIQPTARGRQVPQSAAAYANPQQYGDFMVERRPRAIVPKVLNHRVQQAGQPPSSESDSTDHTVMEASKYARRRINQRRFEQNQRGRAMDSSTPARNRARGRAQSMAPEGISAVHLNAIHPDDMAEEISDDHRQSHQLHQATAHLVIASSRGRSKNRLLEPRVYVDELPKYTPIRRAMSLQHIDDSPEMEQLLRSSAIRRHREGEARNATDYLPNRSLFGNDRSSVASSTPRHKPIEEWAEGQNRHLSRGTTASSPTSLFSADEGTPPVRRSVPMKERVAPAPKKPARKAPKASATQKKTPTAKRSKKYRGLFWEEEIDENVALNTRAALHIIGLEAQAENNANEELERGLFGEVSRLTEEEQKKQAAAAKAAEARSLSREKKEKDRMVEEEAKAAAEAEKQRRAEGEAELRRMKKVEQDKRDKARREKQRQKDAETEENLKEERRRKALKLIEDSRKKETEAAKVKAAEALKATSVQANAEELQRLKAKQEQAKWNAAGLKRASNLSKNPKARDEPSKVITAADEDDLFVGDETDHDSIYDVDERSGTKSTAPTNAAQLFAASGGDWRGRKTFREEREEFERQKEQEVHAARSQFLRNRIYSMYPRDKSVPFESPPNKTTPRGKGKPKAASAQQKKFTSNASSKGTAPFAPIVTARTEEASQPCRKSVGPSAQSLTQKPQSQFASQIKLVADVERELAISAAEEEKQKKALERRKKDNEKVRAKHVQKLIDDANKIGYTISDTEIQGRADAYMNKREEEYQKKMGYGTRDKAIFGHNVRNFPPPRPVSQSSSQMQPQSTAPLSAPAPAPAPALAPNTGAKISQTVASKVPAAVPEHRPLTEAERTQQLGAIKDILAKLACGSNGKTTQLAPPVPVPQYREDESEESEEDPDDDVPHPPRVQHPHPQTSVGTAQAAVASEETDADDLEANLERALADGDDDGPETDAEAQPQESEQPAPTRLRIYEVLTTETTKYESNDEEREEEAEELPETTEMVEVNKEIGKLTSLDDANHAALGLYLNLIQKLSPANAPLSKEQQYEEGLFRGTIIYDTHKSTVIEVTYTAMTSDLITNNDDTLDYDKDIKPRFPLYIYFISSSQSQTTTAANGTTTVTKTKEVGETFYTEREMANHAACEQLIAMIKPKSAHMNHIIDHGVATKELIEYRKGVDAKKEMFEAELETDDLAWLAAEGITMLAVSVEKRNLANLAGPKN